MTTPNEFTHDVFLSHNSKDKVVERAVAERSRVDGLHVWFDESEMRSMPWTASANSRIPIEGGCR